VVNTRSIRRYDDICVCFSLTVPFSCTPLSSIQEVDDKQVRLGELSKRVDESSAKLSKAEELLEDINEKLNSKLGTDGTGDAATGAGGSATIRIKEAIKSVKDEIKSMDLQAGLLSHNLLSKQISNAQIKALQRSNRRKNQAANGAVGKRNKSGSRDMENSAENDDDLDGLNL
jgi:hypothetical protein